MKILVTGTTHGIGSKIGELLETAGHDVIELNREDADVGDAQAVQAFFDRLYPDNVPDAIVNNAATHHLEWIEDLPPSAFEQVMRTNLFGYYNVIHYAMRLWLSLERADGKRIVNIGSVAGRIPMRGTVAYNCSKAAVDMLTKVCARELSRHGVWTVQVTPGKIGRTKMTRYLDVAVPHLRGWDPQEAKRIQKELIPLGRFGTVDEVAELVQWLLCEAPDFMLGSLVEISGGQ